MRRATLAVLAAGLLSGCLVVVDDRRPRPSPPPPPPPPARSLTVAYTCTWYDARYVIWREYFDCDDYEVYYCESLWGYDEDDLLVLLFISRVRRVPIRLVVYEYDRHHRDLFAVALFYRMTGDEFFVAGVAPGSCPSPYGRAYGYFWRRERGYRLTNEEVRALVHLRIGVEFYGYAPHEYFREHERLRGGGHVFREVAVRDYRKAGAGGKNVHQAPLKKVERPWEVSSRQEWERRRDEARERARAREAQEPPRHPEAERARRQFEEAERVRRQEEERRKREAEEARRQEEERRKREAEEAARRAREEDQRRQEDLRRRQEEQKRKEEQQKKKEELKRHDDPRRK